MEYADDHQHKYMNWDGFFFLKTLLKMKCIVYMKSYFSTHGLSF